MKKIYVLAFAAIFNNFGFSQIYTEGFESHALAAESHDDGASGNGDFQFNSLVFSNYYDQTYFYYTGFAISNETNTTTPGWANQYSSFAGSGRNSSNFAVFYSDGTISGEVNYAYIKSFYITNSTYAALSMRDGDMYAKQFGSIYDAGGNVDGTNGEDFFKVWVIAEDPIQGMKDSVEVYLADYRFSDNNDDYILDTFTKVDFSAFPFYPTLVSFRFESSDVGQWGINTPTYFVIDDVEWESLWGLDELVDAQLHTYPNPMTNVLHVKGGKGSVELFDVKGNLLLSQAIDQTTDLNVESLPNGVYTLKYTTSEGVAIRKIVK